VGKVTASLDTSHYKGALAKVVTVRTNEPGAAPVVLTLKADVTTLVDVTPTDTPNIRMSVREPKPMELTVAAADGQPFDVLAMDVDGKMDVSVAPAPGAPAAKPKAKEKPKRAGKPPVAAGATRYVVHLVPKADLPIGYSGTMINLTTTVKGAETVPIRASVFVAGRVQVTPSYLGLHPSPEPPVLHLKVRTTGDGLRILGVESTDPDFTAVAAEVQPGREYDVTIRYGGRPGRGRVAARIAVRTNEPGQESLVVPLEGQI
jgi:hypothetical protein